MILLSLDYHFIITKDMSYHVGLVFVCMLCDSARGKVDVCTRFYQFFFLKKTCDVANSI